MIEFAAEPAAERRASGIPPAPVTPQSDAASRRWYAVWTHSHFEQLVSDQLRAKGFDLFLPKAPSWIRRGGRRRRVEVPLFPSYLFLHHALDKASQVEVLKARGVVRILGDRWDRLTSIPDDEIQAVQRLVGSEAPVFPYQLLHVGTRVRITAGPLAGLTGAFVRGRPDRGLFVVAVTLLHRSVAVEVDCTVVEAVADV